MQPEPNHPIHGKKFEISRKAAVGNPRDNKNYRCNPSILIRYQMHEESEKNILIDAGNNTDLLVL
jgi:hypothetical protein